MEMCAKLGAWSFIHKMKTSSIYFSILVWKICGVRPKFCNKVAFLATEILLWICGISCSVYRRIFWINPFVDDQVTNLVSYGNIICSEILLWLCWHHLRVALSSQMHHMHDGRKFEILLCKTSERFGELHASLKLWIH